MIRLLLIFALLIAALPVLAQDTGDESNSAITRFIENQLSTPNRRISLSGIEGALTSDASIGLITIADREGVWLRIENADIVWTRTALLRGRLEINQLTAENIEISRQPLPDEGMPALESRGFELPDLPVSVDIENFEIERAVFGAELFGLASEVTANGSVRLLDGSLDANLDVERLDGPGGRLALEASYEEQNEQLDIALELSEPENGIVANLAGIEGRPPVDLRLSGSGPIGEVDLGLTFDADGRRILDGTAMLRRENEGIRFVADAHGPVGEIVPAPYRPFFGEESRLNTRGLVGEDGVVIESFELDAAELAIEANARVADSFLQELRLTGRISSSDGEPVVLPVPGGQTTIVEALIDVDFATGGSDSWSLNLTADNLAAEQMEIGRIEFEAGGRAEALSDATNRRLTVSGSGAATRISTRDPDIAAALGDEINLNLQGNWRAGEPLVIDEASLSARELLATLTGSVADFKANGDFTLEASDLAPFSGLLGQSVEGSARIAAAGEIEPTTGAFDLTFDGEIGDLRLESDTLDGLLHGTTTINGGFARGASGFETRDFRVANAQMEFIADGTFATGEADFDYEAVIKDLSALSENSQGRLTSQGYARGTGGQIGLSADIEVVEGAFLGKPVSNANLAFSGSRTRENINGQLIGSGELDGAPLEIRSEITLDDNGARAVDGLVVRARGAEITGTLAQSADGLLDGQLEVDAPDISTLAAFFLQEARGSLQARLEFSDDDGRQDLVVDADAEDFSIASMEASSAEAEFEILDLFGVPVADGDMTASGVRAAGVRLSRVDISAVRSDGNTQFEADIASEAGATGAMRGRLEQIENGFALALERLDLRQGDVAATLREPSRITFAGERIAIDTTRMAVGNGGLSVSGEIGDNFDLDLQIDRLPLEIANAFQPELGLEGRLDGEALVTGSRAVPRIRFDLNATAVTAAALRETGIEPVSINATGETTSGRLSVRAEATNGQGLNATADGSVPLSGGNYDLRISGNAPLSLADRFIASRGAQTAGSLEFDMAVGGPRNDPTFDGDFRVSGGQFVDPQTSIRLNDIRIDGQIDPRAFRITSATANVESGGRVSASGQVELDTNFPADISITLDNVRYRERDLVSATVNGNLSVTGPLMRDPVISGQIDVERAEIAVPENFGSGAAEVDVKHVSPPPRVAATLERARGPEGSVAVPTQRPSVVSLDIEISAPRAIFVRGRGLDAELGGRLRITGPVTDIRPVGGFDLIRGRLSVLGQRVVFDEGSVQLVGSLDPSLRFVARVTRSDITVIVTVTGNASNPEISLSSQPPLPEDEIMARLIFNRGLEELSALQIARLAAAAAELAGSGSSLTGRLRKATGLDDIDIYTNEEGETAVRAGRYIREEIYLGVETGTGGKTKGTINLDITDDLKAKGSVSSDGGSGVGIFFERDY